MTWKASLCIIIAQKMMEEKLKPLDVLDNKSRTNASISTKAWGQNPRGDSLRHSTFFTVWKPQKPNASTRKTSC